MQCVSNFVDSVQNLVLEDAVEVTTKKAGRRDVGRILLKGMST